MQHPYRLRSLTTLAIFVASLGYAGAGHASEEVTTRELVEMLRKQSAEIELLKAEVSRLHAARETHADAPAVIRGSTPLVEMRPSEIEALVDRKVQERMATTSASAPPVDSQLDRLSDSLFGLEFHGAMTQAFLVSDSNQFLNIDTEGGSFAYTDGTFNVSKQLTDTLRAGMQIYVRKFGEDQDHEFELDWANIDWHWRDWMGFRVGRVKTVMGLFSDSQDLDMVHTWALSPAAVYNPSHRGTSLSHNGVDVYGNLPVWRLGTLNYTAFVGGTSIPDYDGYLASLTTAGYHIDDAETPFMAGFDLHLQPGGRLAGLTLGVSQVYFTYDIEASGPLPPSQVAALTGNPADHAWAEITASEADGPNVVSFAYAEYQHNRFRLMAEYRREYIDSRTATSIPSLGYRDTMDEVVDGRGWYAGGSYRFNDRLELGTYFARYIRDNGTAHDTPGNYQDDLAFTVRFDVNKHWYVKVEDHIMRGWGLSHDFRDPGNAEHWNLFVIKTGVSF